MTHNHAKSAELTATLPKRSVHLRHLNHSVFQFYSSLVLGSVGIVGRASFLFTELRAWRVEQQLTQKRQLLVTWNSLNQDLKLQQSVSEGIKGQCQAPLPRPFRVKSSCMMQQTRSLARSVLLLPLLAPICYGAFAGVRRLFECRVFR